MRKWTKTAGVLFMAASAVYSDQAALAAAAKPANKGVGAKAAAPKKARVARPPSANVAPATDVALVEPTAGTEGTTGTAGTASTQPADEAPTTAPADATVADPFAAPAAGEGQSVTSSEVNISDAGTVEIHVNDANLVEVLRMLSLQAQKNIVASKDVRGTVTANLYDVTVREALDAILKANGYGYREKGNFIYVYTQKELQEIEKQERQPVTEVFRLHYTPAANAVTMIKPVLSADGQVSFTTPAKSGVDSGNDNDLGGDSHATEDILVVSDYPDRIEQVRRILREVDKRPQQVLVEAVIMRATLKEDNELGIDFTVLGGVDFNNLVGLSDAGGGGGGGGGGSSSLGSGVNQALNGTILDNPNAGPVVDGKGYGAGRVGGSGLKVGVVTNNVSLFVSALEGVTDTVVMANPKVLVLNKQKGEVHVGARLGYQTTVSTEVLAAQDIKFLEIGTRLIFRPYIGDNGYIRLEVKPEDSSGVVNDKGLPSEFVTEVTTNVMVKDGRTIVIGGLFRESSDTSRSGVPVLQNLPGVGPLFRRQKDATVREEVIILLTPHIVKDEEQYFDESDKALAHGEQMRVGVRKGMMPWGRERLAETAFEHALAEMNKANPDRQKALWHLDSAINLNPKFAEAIEMKQQITGEVVTAVDNSSIRHFVRRQVMAERQGGATVTPPADDRGTRGPAAPEETPTATDFPAEEPAATEVAEVTPEGPTTAPADEATDVVATTTEVTEVMEAEATAEPTTQPGDGQEPAETETAGTDTTEVVNEVPFEAPGDNSK